MKLIVMMILNWTLALSCYGASVSFELLEESETIQYGQALELEVTFEGFQAISLSALIDSSVEGKLYCLTLDNPVPQGESTLVSQGTFIVIPEGASFSDKSWRSTLASDPKIEVSFEYRDLNFPSEAWSPPKGFRVISHEYEKTTAIWIYYALGLVVMALMAFGIWALVRKMRERRDFKEFLKKRQKGKNQISSALTQADFEQIYQGRQELKELFFERFEASSLRGWLEVFESAHYEKDWFEKSKEALERARESFLTQVQKTKLSDLEQRHSQQGQK